MRNNQILDGARTRCEEIFVHGRPRMLTRDQLAVANFLLHLHCMRVCYVSNKSFRIHVQLIFILRKPTAYLSRSYFTLKI